VNEDGTVRGAVDDGDGVLADDDDKIANGSFAEGVLAFEQTGADGSTTQWRANYDESADTLVGGTWSGSTEGTFTARRAAAEGGEETAATVPRTASEAIAEAEAVDDVHLPTIEFDPPPAIESPAGRRGPGDMSIDVPEDGTPQ
jgi:hypothetical protein